ncbi:hypothetical protein [endosymbiont GvMRE of Glomus versiforme]|nr:hypothetical protein [endosymbiont GvMRE of Glomus versiforme]RHZ35482.1 hypothetical protein GvMRE_IIg577 [endosymbiont GvMRE of Glomus versiforme]
MNNKKSPAKKRKVNHSSGITNSAQFLYYKSQKTNKEVNVTDP